MRTSSKMDRDSTDSDRLSLGRKIGMDVVVKSLSAAIVTAVAAGWRLVPGHPRLVMATVLAAGIPWLWRKSRNMAIDQVEQFGSGCGQIELAGATGTPADVLKSLLECVLANHPGEGLVRIEAMKPVDQERSLQAVLSLGWSIPIEGRLYPLGDETTGEGGSVAGRAFLDRQLQYVGNGVKSDMYHTFDDRPDQLCGKSVSVASMCVYKPGQDRPCGVIAITSPRKRYFDERDLYLLVVSAFALGRSWSLAA